MELVELEFIAPGSGLYVSAAGLFQPIRGHFQGRLLLLAGLDKFNVLVPIDGENDSDSVKGAGLMKPSKLEGHRNRKTLLAAVKHPFVSLVAPELTQLTIYSRTSTTGCSFYGNTDPPDGLTGFKRTQRPR